MYIYFCLNPNFIAGAFPYLCELGNAIIFNVINFHCKLALFYCVLFSFNLFCFILLYVKYGAGAFLCSSECETQSFTSIYVLMYVYVWVYGYALFG